MKLTKILLAIAVPCLLMPIVASANTVNVAATANIYSAGLLTPVAPGGGGAGILPVQISLTPGLSTFQFQYLSGTVTPNQSDGSLANLDGKGTALYSTALNPNGGVSGFISDRAFGLVGVFLTAATPQAPAPATLNFSSGGIGPNFLTLSPLIGQVFLIGDGVTAASQTQTFYAPAGATRLYLGFGDAFGFEGDIGQYADNAGSLNINVTAVPEPTTAGLMLAGSALLVAFRYRKCGKPKP